MTLLILIKLIAIVILLLLSAISSGSETALTAVSKLQAHRQNEKGIKNSRFILRIKDLKDEFITGILIANILGVTSENITITTVIKIVATVTPRPPNSETSSSVIRAVARILKRLFKTG